jgi:hypothetical protein|tara:strand:- start:1218 stop:2273 length:1056 start_codon:yes stop_codon:yes gene_type:complete
MLQFLPYALAAYGGYKGYKGSKDAGGSGIQRLLAGATGAAAGYYGGKGVLAGGSALNAPGFPAAQSAFTPFTQLDAVQNISSSLPFLGSSPNTAAQTKELAALNNSFYVPQNTDPNTGGGLTDIFNKLLRRKRFEDGVATGEMEFSPGKVASAIGIGSYLSGAFDPQPQDIYTPTYNLAVAELQKQRGGFKYIDPVTGDEKVFDQPYIPEADPANQGDFRQGPYAIEKTRLKDGGLAEVKRFNEGGVNYLPSKRSHDEDDAHNYVRASGYVEDGSGTGDKDEDTMLAQLADGEFVTRADGVLGAGIIAGANPGSMKDMREKGAQYFYNQQKRYKRVFDLLEGSRNAQAKAN